MAQNDGTASQKRPILVEILAYAPTQFFHCQHCEFVWQQTGATDRFHRESLESSIPPDLQKQYADLGTWVLDTVETYGGRVIFKVIDATSVEGLLKSVRYSARHYPAFVVDGQSKYIGADFSAAKRLIDKRLESIQTPP